jgi:hypothetical protein
VMFSIIHRHHSLKAAPEAHFGVTDVPP